MRDPQPMVSIIICTRDRPSDLELTLASIGKAFVPDDWTVEMVVVDNGPSPETAEVVRGASVGRIALRYLEEPRTGQCFARNTGIAATHGKVVLFTDDDVRVPQRWIGEMCSPILDGAVKATQGGVRPAPHLDRTWLTGSLRVWVAAVEHPTCKPEGLVGANMAFSRSVLALTGTFDTRLGPGAAGFFDDTVFGWALEKTGEKILYLPKVAVEHHFSPERLSMSSFVRTARKLARSRAIVMQGTREGVRPTLFDLLKALPGLGYRSVTQAARFLYDRRPDPGFLVRLYELCLWAALRRSGNPSDANAS
jgi:glycosyltransferase involved in cell wall biosynthesis